MLPNGFDTQFHAYFDGIGAYGNATQPVEIISTGSGTAPERIIDATRRGIAARIDQTLSQPAAGVARALINGDQSAVTDEVRETMSIAGLAHVLSVSGLHLTIVAALVLFTLRGGLALLPGWDSASPSSASRPSARSLPRSATMPSRAATSPPCVRPS